MSALRSTLVVLVLASGVVASDLPVKRVTIYSSGVACFERSGSVDGDVTIHMPFKTEQINDILKSLVLIDSAGERAEVVYASQDPIEKSLKAFGIDLTGKPTLRELFEQLRGVRMELNLHTQSEPVTGRVLGVEVHRVVDEDGKVTEVEYVNLSCEGGLRSFAIRDLRSAQLLDPQLDAELEQALQVLAGSRDVSKKSVALRFAGQGRREVTAAYVLEAPIWKTSYRLVLSDDEKPLLQGWAMVDNTTDEDWADVQLTLVSGRPISFVQDLYSPLYVPRPEVQPEIYASLRPRRYEGAVEEEADQEERMAGRMRAKRSAQARGAAPEAPAAAMADALTMQVTGGTPAITAATAGVASLAEAAEAGELFRYAIRNPVTIGRQKSAMLPIVNQSVQVEKLSIYNQAVQAKYPLNGVQLTNTTDLNLMQGPVTVFDDGVYAGDAQLDDLSPGEKRLVSYALDLEREVTVDAESAPSQIMSVRIANGTLIVKNKYVQAKQYRIKNKGDAARTVMVEHPYSADWKLIEPAEPAERTGQLYRFRVEAPSGKTTTLSVREERVVDQHVAIRNAGEDVIALYLRSNVISDKVRRALERVAAMRTELSRLEREQNRLQAKLQSITQEQERLRANLQAVERDSNLYRRYIAKLESQETEIEETQAARKDIESKIEQQRRELDDYLLNLDIE